jgi:PTH1 family peptidyl-tRNA hydrolase
VAAVIVGLGNPGPAYRDTRHSIGHRVLDHLAGTLGQSFSREGRALVARGEWRGEALTLVTLLTFMNVSGPAVAGTLAALGAGAGDLVLVHDDLDLPLGKVRVRMKGSHGGHNGVRSVIEALGTEEIRRVKVGIGRPGQGAEVVDHVLAPFEPEERAAIDTAVAEAAARVLALVGEPLDARRSRMTGETA